MEKRNYQILLGWVGNVIGAILVCSITSVMFFVCAVLVWPWIKPNISLEGTVPGTVGTYFAWYPTLVVLDGSQRYVWLVTLYRAVHYQGREGIVYRYYREHPSIESVKSVQSGQEQT